MQIDRFQSPYTWQRFYLLACRQIISIKFIEIVSVRSKFQRISVRTPAGNPPTRLNPLNPSNFQIPKKPTSRRANRSGKKRFQLLREFLHGARCNYTVAHRGLCPRDSLPPEKLFPLGVGRFAAASPHSRRIILGQRR